MRRITIVVLMALTACAPNAPLQIGSKEVSVDLVLGRQHKPVAPAPPHASNPGVIGFPGFVGPPPPRLDPGVPPPPAPSPVACPKADPLAAAELAAPVSVQRRPTPHTYRFHNAGSFGVEGKGSTAYPPEQTRTITEVAPTDRGSTFAVRAVLAGTTTVSRYSVVNIGATPDRGLYLTQVVTTSTTDTDDFTPETPILLMPFPQPELGTNLEDETAQVAGPSYRSQGTDPIHGTTMTLTARNDGKLRVDACGRWIDAWKIEILEGRIESATSHLTFTGHYAIATQYGGLIVQDDISLGGTELTTDGVETVHSTNRATISSVPV